MKNLARIITTVAITAIVIMSGTKQVYAEGLGVTADKESCEIGDKVTITVDAQIGDATAPPDVSVDFNSNRLNFETCSAEYGGGAGGLVTFKDTTATMEFTTLSGGNAEVKVTATAEDAEQPESTVITVSVNGDDTAAALDDSVLTSTGVSEGAIDIGDGRVIQSVFADEFKPVLFHKETTEYNGQTVECAKFDMGDVTLLYTTNVSGEDGKFMMYNSSTSELSECRMIMGIENRFIIVLPDCEGPIPEGYTKAVLEWSGQTLTAFMEEDVAAGTSQAVDGIDPADFFLVYAISSEGNKGWYRYDKNEGTYQRFMTGDGGNSLGEGADDTDDSSSTGSIIDEYIPSGVRSILLLILAPLCLLLLIIVIVLAVKNHDYAEDLDAFYDDYYGDEEDEDEVDEEEEEERYVRRASKPGAVTAASLVGKSMSEDDEEEEEEEEEDEEDEEETAQEEDDAAEDAGYPEETEEAEDEEEEDVKNYRPLTRRERKELEREEKWRAKEEKKAAKRRAKGYEEATPMDWSSFEKGNAADDDRMPKGDNLPKYMTESMEPVPEQPEPDVEEEPAVKKKAPLPPRKKTVYTEEEQPRVLKEEDQREKQRRLFEQQQRIEEQRRIEKEQQEAEARKQQQQFIAAKNEDLDLDEDFQFEFLNL